MGATKSYDAFHRQTAAQVLAGIPGYASEAVQLLDERGPSVLHDEALVYPCLSPRALSVRELVGGVERVCVDGRCRKCGQCRRYRALEVAERLLAFQATDLLVLAHRRGVDVDAYQRDCSVFMSMTVLPPDRGGCYAGGGSFAVRLRKLRSLARRNSDAYFLKVELQGEAAAFRPHVHLALFGVSDGFPRYEGMQWANAPGSRIAEFLDMASKLPYVGELYGGPPFWGSSHVRGLDPDPEGGGLAGYLAKEFAKAEASVIDLAAADSDALVDAHLIDKAGMRRVVGVAYSRRFSFAGRDPAPVFDVRLVEGGDLPGMKPARRRRLMQQVDRRLVRDCTRQFALDCFDQLRVGKRRWLVASQRRYDAAVTRLDRLHRKEVPVVRLSFPAEASRLDALVDSRIEEAEAASPRALSAAPKRAISYAVWGDALSPQFRRALDDADRRRAELRRAVDGCRASEHMWFLNRERAAFTRRYGKDGGRDAQEPSREAV